MFSKRYSAQKITNGRCWQLTGWRLQPLSTLPYSIIVAPAVANHSNGLIKIYCESPSAFKVHFVGSAGSILFLSANGALS
jgi:hypothetical protein